MSRKRRVAPIADDLDIGFGLGASHLSSFSDEENSGSDQSFDISSALTQRRVSSQKGKAPLVPHDDGTDDDSEFEEMIRSSISRRNVKDGTGLLKDTKGKKKLSKGEVGGGSFQNMGNTLCRFHRRQHNITSHRFLGLYPWILRSLMLQGFRTPTPIQRLSIPVLLSNPPRDLVGMARTGSGKSLAFLIPLVQRLGGRHSSTFGARALILLPTRELALQILRVGKELARGWRDDGGEHAGDKETGDQFESRNRSQGLRWGLVVGGESMDEQFEMISSNPDVYACLPRARHRSDRSYDFFLMFFYFQYYCHPWTTPAPRGRNEP